MLALGLVTLLTVIGTMTVALLADGGLRWWSAFRHLRQVLKNTGADTATGSLPELRGNARTFTAQGNGVRPSVRAVSVSRATARAAA